MTDPDALQERIRKLAGEKANLQLIIDLMNRISRASGLQETISNMLAAVSETIGGTDSVIYYFVDGSLFMTSASGAAEKLVDVDDPLVTQVLEDRKTLEIAGAFSATRMMTAEFSKALTWVAPLMVGNEMIGVLKIENLHMSATEIWPGLPTFVDFAAVVLKNEIASQTRLRKANDELARVNAELVDDIRKLKAAEDDLRRATEEEQAVFNAATVGIVLTKDQRIIRCNQTMEKLFGYEPGALIGKRTRIFYPDDESYKDASDRFLDEASGHLDERKLVRKDGQLFWCRRMVQAIDVGDLSKGFAGTFEDITLERAALDEMASARSIAEEAATAKSRFLANMSHEIRTPMNAVIGMAHLAMNADPSPRVREYLAKIQSSSRHLLGIINDILDFSKIEAGKMQIEAVEFDLETLIEDAIGLVAERAAEKGLEIVVHIDASVPRGLVGDPLRLGQILINFLNNAVKFTDAGVILVDVKPSGVFEDGGLLLFSVRDTGIGISEEQRGRLFHSFQQVDSSTTRKYGGTGLGLVIAKRLAEAMGGQVGVESAPGKGSIFWFSARVSRGKGQRETSHAAMTLHGKRILVVDDLEDARQVAREILESLGFVVTTVASGGEALDELDRVGGGAERYDVVLLDWQMPEMDGLTLAQRIRGRIGDGAPVVLMITAYDREQIAEAAQAAGVREVLTKPVTPSGLLDSIAKVLGNETHLHARPSRGQETHDFSGGKALLVEDNELNQEVAAELLKELGLSVDIAADGAIAVEKAIAGDYDVILMDLQMPVMDGVEATRKLRQDPRFAKTPIIAMTASAMPADRERCLAAGMNDHIAKPIEPKLLHATLSKWLPDLEMRAHALQSAADGAARARLFPQAIDGLDVAGGLRRVMGNQDLYLRLLRGFAAEQKSAPDQIAEAIGDARAADAERLVHTLKGLSGNIGAVTVQRAAEGLEEALAAKRPSEVLADLVSALREHVNALVTQLEQIPAVAPASGGGGQEKLASVCESLERLLGDCDVLALDVLRENADLLRAAYPDICSDIERNVEKFEFEAALQKLRDARPGGVSFQS